MRILDKHILKEFISSLLFCTIIFLFIFIMVDSFSNINDFITSKIPISMLLYYYLNLIPAIFIQTVPLAVLLSMIYTTGRLNYNNELIAMRTGGLSIYKIVMPIILFGIVLSIFLFFVSEKIVPKSQEISDNIRATYIDKKGDAQGRVIQNVAIYGFKNRQFFINSLNTKTKTIDGLTIMIHDPRQNVVSKVYAEKAVWQDGSWLATNCFVYKYDTNNRVIDSAYFPNYKLNIEETPQDFLRQSQQVMYMNSKQMYDYIIKLSSSGGGVDTALRYLWIDLYQKLFSPFTVLVMIFIGLPCAMAISRKAVGFSSVGISILVALLYYVLQAISLALGKNGLFPPMASALLTPIFFICSSIYLIYLTP